MKSVLASIKPKYCELIASGKKKVEVRKTKPKIETPFKVYIYCTESKSQNLMICNVKECYFDDWGHLETFLVNQRDYKTCFNEENRANGKVIGEFICDYINTYEIEGYNSLENVLQSIKRVEGEEDIDEDDILYYFETSNEMEDANDCDLCKNSCLSFDEIGKYVCGNKEFGFYTFYGWHISKLVIYEKPHYITNILKKPCVVDPCVNRGFCAGGTAICHECKIKSAPQSWCYVEERAAKTNEL